VESADIEFETRSLPNLLVATLATLPSMSLIPSAPFADMFLRLRHFLDHRQAERLLYNLFLASMHHKPLMMHAICPPCF
jgi:hypothetical protein